MFDFSKIPGMFGGSKMSSAKNPKGNQSKSSSLMRRGAEMAQPMISAFGARSQATPPPQAQNSFAPAFNPDFAPNFNTNFMNGAGNMGQGMGQSIFQRYQNMMGGNTGITGGPDMMNPEVQDYKNKINPNRGGFRFPMMGF